MFRSRGTSRKAGEANLEDNRCNAMYTDAGIGEIVSSWNIKYRKSRPEIEIAGSPERTSCRVVLEDEESTLWILEAVPPDSRVHKARISEALRFLRRRGLRSVHPCLRSDDNGCLIRISRPNRSRFDQDDFGEGEKVWVSWDGSSPVVLQS